LIRDSLNKSNMVDEYFKKVNKHEKIYERYINNIKKLFLNDLRTINSINRYENI